MLPESDHETKSTEDAAVDALILYNVLRTHNTLTPYIDRGLRTLNVTSGQLNTLILLQDAGEEGLPLSDIGRRLVVTKANMTGVIDRMERTGLVQRLDDPSDRRITRAIITTEGKTLLEEAMPRQRRMLAELMQGLTAGEKEQLVGLLTRLRRGVRAQQKKEGGDECPTE